MATIHQRSSSREEGAFSSQGDMDLIDHAIPPHTLLFGDIDPNDIDPSPFQARQSFGEEALADLADSIAEHGIVSRLRVRRHPEQEGRYQLVFGERRLRAAKMLGLAHVPCEIADYTDDELNEIGLIENIQREALTPLEEAARFREMLKKGLSYRKLAQKIGKDKSYIEDRVKLLDLPEDVKQLIEDVPQVSLRAWREIAKVPTVESRKPLLKQIRAGKVTSTEQIRAEVERILAQLSGSVTPSDDIVVRRAYNKAAGRLTAASREVEHFLGLCKQLSETTTNTEWLHSVQQLVTEVQPLMEKLERINALAQQGEQGQR